MLINGPPDHMTAGPAEVFGFIYCDTEGATHSRRVPSHGPLVFSNHVSA